MEDCKEILRNIDEYLGEISSGIGSLVKSRRELGYALPLPDGMTIPKDIIHSLEELKEKFNHINSVLKDHIASADLMLNRIKNKISNQLIKCEYRSVEWQSCNYLLNEIDGRIHKLHAFQSMINENNEFFDNFIKELDARKEEV